MKKRFYYFILIFLLFFQSCSKKEVLLPLITMEGIHEIQNHSSIWIFFEIEKQDTLAVLNKNNKLLNTHWILNIDKRLPMGKIVPILEDLQKNRNKDSMHKKEGMLNYFSYADQVTNKISLLNFLSTFYVKNENDFNYLFEEPLNKRLITLEIDKDHFILDKKSFDKNKLKESLENFTKKDSLQEPVLILKYEENLSYQDYLSAKAFLSNEGFPLDKTEYIYTIK